MISSKADKALFDRNCFDRSCDLLVFFGSDCSACLSDSQACSSIKVFYFHWRGSGVLISLLITADGPGVATASAVPPMLPALLLGTVSYFAPGRNSDKCRRIAGCFNLMDK